MADAGGGFEGGWRSNQGLVLKVVVCVCVDCRVGGEWMVQGWWLGTVSDGIIVVGGWEGLDYRAYATLIPQLQWFFSRMSSTNVDGMEGYDWTF